MKSKIIVFTLCAMLFALCGSVDGQQTGKVFRIGFLDNSNASGMAVLVNAFRQELSSLGWIDGKNIAIEYRFAEQKLERLPELSADLVRLKVELIVAVGTAATLAAKSTTATIPIVSSGSSDPVGTGLIASLARREGKSRGLRNLAAGLNTKRLEKLKAQAPKVPQMGF